MTDRSRIDAHDRQLGAIERFLDGEHPGWNKPRRCESVKGGIRCDRAELHDGPHKAERFLDDEFKASWRNRDSSSGAA